ncbi:MAG: hypothetical protein WC718_17705, partial [Phycisphaerales bacterium]
MKSLSLLALLFAVTPAGAGEVRIAAVTQSWADQDRTLAHVLAMLDRAVADRAAIVVLPQDCV